MINITYRSADFGYTKGRKESKEDKNMSAIHINKENFQDIVVRAEKKVLLDFWPPTPSGARICLHT